MTTPREWMLEGSWPDGTLDPMAPPVVRRLRHVASTVLELLEDRSMARQQLADDAGIDPTDLDSFLLGTEIPNLELLAQLEQALRNRLWP
jgi:hypothetical protein